MNGPRLARSPRQSRPAPRRRRLLLEQLEDRRVLAALTWDGGGLNNNWSTPENWVGDTAPVAGDDLIFDTSVAGLTRFTATNNSPGFAVNTIQVLDGSATNNFTLNGQSITLAAGLTAGGSTTGSLASTTIGFNSILLAGPQEFELSSGALSISSNIDTGGHAFAFTGNSSNGGTISGVISGSGSVTKTGTTILSLNAPNTYTGQTLVSGGSVYVRQANSLGSTSGGTVVDGGSLLIFDNVSTSEPLSLAGTGSFGNGSLSGGNNSVVSGGVTLTNNTLVKALNTNSHFRITGAISDGGAGFGIDINFTQTGQTLTLGGANTYSGPTKIQNAGILSVGVAGAIPDASAVTLAASASVLKLNDAFVTIGSLSGPGSVDLGAGALTTGANNGHSTYSGTLSGTGGLTKLGAGTFTLSGANTYTGATIVQAGVLQVTSAMALGTAAGGTTVANGATLAVAPTSFASYLEPLTLNGSGHGLLGALRSEKAASWNGLISLGSATTVIQADQAFGIGGNINNNGFELTYNQNAISTHSGDISGVISGNGSFVKTGQQQLNLSGANTYSGLTTVQGGILSISGNGQLGNLSAGTLVVDGASLSVGTTNTPFAEPLSIEGNGAPQYNGGALHGHNNTNVAGPITLTGNARIAVYNSNSTMSISGPIGDGGNGFGLTLNAFNEAGRTLVLSGNNTYSGTTTVNSGRLKVLGGTAIADSSAVTIATGATFELASSESIGALTGSGDVELGANTLTTGANGTSTSFSGVISGAGGVTKSGAGTLTLTNTGNSYTGPTTILGGVLSTSHLANGGINSPIGASTNAATNLILNGGTLRYTGSAASTDRLFSVGSAGGTIDDSSPTYVNLDFVNPGAIGFNGQSGPRTLTVTGGHNTLTLSPILGDNGGASSLVATKDGDLFVLGDNTYSGTTTVTNGSLWAGANSNTGSLGSGIVTNDASIVFSRTDEFTVGNTINGVGSLTKTGSGTLALTGVNSYTGATIVTAGVLSVGLLANGGVNSNIGASSNAASNLIVNGGTVRYTGPSVTTDRLFSVGGSGGGATIDSSGSGSLTFNNTGALALSNGVSTLVLTLTGSSPGTFFPTLADDVGAVSSLLVSGSSQWELRGNNTYSGTTTITDAVLLVGGGSAAGSLGSGPIVDNGHLYFTRSDAITIANPISGSGRVYQAANGSTLTLDGTHSYTGDTFVNQGTLLVNGSIVSAVTVQGGTLGGTGTTGAISVNAGGTLAPGNSPGILHLGNATFAPGSTFRVDLDGIAPGTQFDQLIVNGGVNIDAATLAIDALTAPSIGDRFLILDNQTDERTEGTFVSLPQNGFVEIAGRHFQIDYQAGPDGNDIELRSVVTPRVSLTSIDRVVAEDVGILLISAVLENPLAVDVRIPYSIHSATADNGQDYQILNSSFAFAAGETTTSLEIQIADDLVDEPSESFTIALAPNDGISLGTVVQNRITITDNDSAPSVRFAKLSQVAQEGQTISIEVSLTAPSGFDVTVPLVFSGSAGLGNDYTINGGTTITIPGNQGLTRGSKTISIVNDSTGEAAELIRVAFGTIANATPSIEPGDPLRHVITIPQNDSPSVRFTQSLVKKAENGGTVTAVVQLSNPTDKAVMIPFGIGGTASTSDRTIRVGSTVYSGSSGSLTIPAFATSGAISIQIVNDSLDESDENVQLSLRSNSDAALGSTANYRLNIIDDDTPIITFAASNASSVWEDGGSVNFTVSTTLQSDQPITVPISLSANNLNNTAGYAQSGSDFSVSVANLVIPPFTSQISRTVTITNDTANERTEKIVLGLGTPSRGKLGAKATQTIDIKDNDPAVSIAAAKSGITEDNVRITFTVALDDPTNVPVKVRFAPSGTARNGTDYTIENTSSDTVSKEGKKYFVTIPAGQQTATIAVNLIEDSIDENNETVTLALGAITGGASLSKTTSATTTINDDDGPPIVYLSTSDFNMREGDWSWRSVTFNLNRVSAKDVRVKPFYGSNGIRASQNIDFSVAGLDSQGYVTIPAGKTSAVFQVRPLDDNPARYQGTRSFYIRIAAAINAGITKDVYGGSVSVYIFDNEGTSSANCIESDADAVGGEKVALLIPEPGQFVCYETGTTTSGETVTLGADPGVLTGVLYNVAITAGFLDGTSVFFDGNFNGVLDFLDINGDGIQDIGEPSEPVTTTLPDGSFTLVIPTEFDLDDDGLAGPDEGRWVSYGGVDTSTNLPWTTRMYGTPGHFVITPLTTLASELVRGQSFTLEDASQRVIDAFALPPASISTLNPLSGLANGDAIAARYWVTHVELYSTVVQIAELFAGASGALPVSFFADLVYADLAEKIADPESGTDLAAANVIADILTGVSTVTGIEFTSDVISGAADVIVAGNQAINALPATNDRNYATAISKVKKVAQGDAAAALRAVGAGTQSIADVLASFTGANLQSRIDAATVGTVIPSVLGVTDTFVREGNSGTTILEFTIHLLGDHDDPVTVDYATADGSATAGVDYTAKTGTLTWAAHDVEPQTIQVVVQSDSEFESDEIVQLFLSNGQHAVLRKPLGYGFIFNDDAGTVAASVPGSGNSNELRLVHSSLNESVLENGETVSDGTYIDPLLRTIIGRDDISDTLILDFTTETYRPDTINFDAGGGSGIDGAEIHGGTFSTITQTLLNPTDGRTVLQPLALDGAVTFNWLGLEPFLINAGSVEQMIFELPPGVTSAVLEDADPTDNDPTLAGKLKLRSPDGHFETTIFPNPTVSLTIHGGSGTDTISIASLDAAFGANLIIDGDFSGTDPVTVSIQGSINAPPLLHVQATSFDVNAAITDIANVGELRVDVATATLNAAVDVKNVVLAGGTLVVGSSLLDADVTVQNGGTLAGNGTVSGLVSVQSGGHIAPGPGVGKLTVGSLTLTSGSQVDIDINGVNVGEFDQIADPVGLNLGGATLNVSLGTIPAAGTVFPIIVNRSELAPPSAFAGLPHGAKLVVDSTLFEIAYSQTAGVEFELRVLTTTPASNPGGPYSATEGVALNLDGSRSSDQEDPNAALTFDWDLNYDGSTFDVDATGEQPRVVFGDNAVGQVVGLRVTDSDGATHLSTTTVNVANRNPDLTITNASIVAAVGSQAVNTGAFGDVPADTVTLNASVGDVFALNGQWVWMLDVDSSVPASQTVTVTATDEDGGETESTFELLTFNVPPLITSLSGDTTGIEGATFAYQVEVLNLSGATLTYFWSFGDGSASVSGSGLASVQHRFADDGVYPVTVMVFDDPADTGTVRIMNVTVNNANPAPSIVSVSTVRVEGTQVDVTAAATDPAGTNDTLTYSYSVLKNGVTFASGNGVDKTTFSFTPDDNGEYEITLTVTDEDSGSATASETITVANVPPTVASHNASVVVTEGATATNTGTFGDVGNDAVTITASRGTITQNNSVGTWNWSLATTDGPDDSGTITITATDNDNAVTTTTFDLTVNNAPPTVMRNLATVTVTEGATATNGGMFGDVGLDTVTITASRGTIIQNNVAGTWSWSLATTDGPGDSEAITITATDSDNAVTTTTFELTVNNAPPTVTRDLATVTAIEGATVTNAGTFGDIGDDTVTITASRGTIAQNNAVGTWSWSLATTDGPDGSGAITITATDSDNAVTTTTFDLTVNNAPPTVTKNLAAVTVIEGATAINAGTFGDVGDDTVAITASRGTVTQNNSTGIWSWSLATTDGPDDSGTITITATDSDNAVTTTTFDLTVNNAPPTVTRNLATVTVTEGATATNSGTFGDVGLDTVTITASRGTITQNNAAGTWSWSLATTDGPDDSEAITITATDSDNAVTTTTFELTVNNAPPTVTRDLATVTAIEGATVTNAGTFGDTGDDTVTITASRGTIAQNNAVGTWSWSLATTDGPDESGAITITATDSDNAVTTTTFDLTVNNAPPTVTKNLAAVSVIEGATAINAGTFGDVGDDTVAITASRGTMTQNNVAGTWSWSLATTDGPDDSGTITITATDSDNAVTATSFTLTVNNAPPTVTRELATVTVIEGATAINTGTFGDVADDTVAITASRGTIAQNNAVGTWSWSLATADGPDGSGTITITATDSDNAVTTTTFDLSVSNAPPSVTKNLATVTVIEGATAINTGTFGDVGDDTVTITASRGTITQDNTAGTWSWVLATTDGPDDSETITITATDSDNAVTTTTFDLTVDNAPPTVTTNLGSVTVTEGATATNTGSFADVGNDTVAITASRGTIAQSNVAGTWSWSLATTDGPDESGTVTITATDSDNAVTTASFELTVNNAPPTVTKNLAAVSVTEGATAINAGTFGDVGDDTVAITASRGTITQNNVAGTWSWSLATTDGTDNSGAITITATDSDNATTTTTFDLTVNNAPPTVTRNLAAVTAIEGETATNAGTFGDIGDDTVTITASRGTIAQNNVAGTWSWSLAATDGPDDSGTITVTATDSDNAVTTTSFDLTVDNASPTVAANQAAVAVTEGTSAINTGTFADVGLDTVTITASRGTITQNNAAGTWSWSLATTDGPDDSGTITITATDSDNAVTTTTFDLTVNNAPPTVTRELAIVTFTEGATAINAGTFGDVGVDTVAITASRGTVTQNNATGTWSWSLATTDGPDNSGTITITATDSDNAVTTTTFDLTVNNAPPTVAANQATVTVNESQTATNSGTFGDVGNDTVTISASRGTVTQNNATGTWSWSLATTDGPDDSGTITITATDSDSAVTTTTFGLTVNNVPPTVASDLSTVTVTAGATATNSGTFGDVGDDIVTVTVAASIGVITQNNIAGTWSWSLATSNGAVVPPTVTIIATDSDGAASQTSFQLSVSTVNPIVRRALQLDADLMLASTLTPRQNALGLNEKWLRDINKVLYYITPSGDFYRWEKGFPPTSTWVAQLGPDYYTDPALLYDAAKFLDTSPAGLPSTLSLMDEVYGFELDGDHWENWGNRGEKWFKDRNNAWYFILPTGDLYLWDGKPRATGELIATLGPTVHADPSLLWNAYVVPEGEATAAPSSGVAAALRSTTIALHDITPPFPIRIGAWTNPLNELDVNRDGFVSPLDALIVINRINEIGTSLQLVANAPVIDVGDYYDVTNDGWLSPLDVLQIINAFNANSLADAEGSVAAIAPDAALEDDSTAEDTWGIALEKYLTDGDEAWWNDLVRVDD